jgi:Ca2+-binding EF-hand superfamily protein
MAMVRLVAAVAILVMLWAQAALTQTVETPLQRAMEGNPGRFEATMLDLVAGFGGPDGLTQVGIAEHVALERAAGRAGAMRRLMAMDLNADGDVQRNELQVAQQAASAASRGRMERQFAAADEDGDGKVTAAEIAADGAASALGALGADEEALLMSLLTLDANGDAALSAAELRTAVARLGGGN